MGLLAVLALIVAHGFFVAGEFGIVAVDRSKIEQLAEDGNRSAKSTLEALKTLSFQLSGAQLGITLTSLIVGFIAEPSIGVLIEPVLGSVGLPEESAGPVAIALALGLATATEMVLGELLPKNLAIARPLPTALRVGTPLRLVNAALRPLIVFLNAAANTTVRLFGIEPREELTRVRSLDELEYLIRSSREEGTIDEPDFSLLAKSISLESKTAADALTPRTAIVALPETATLRDLAGTAAESGFSRIPIYRKDLDDIVGIAHIKDTYRYDPDERAGIRVVEIVQDPLVVPESRSLSSLLFEIRATRKHLAIVIDEYGGTAGLITLEDILEELVGEIEDEYDEPLTRDMDDQPVPYGVHVIEGMLRPDEVREAIGFEFPDGDYETLAGFLLSVIERIPKNGDHISYDGWEFKVVEMDGRRIAKILAVSPGEEQPE